MNGESCLPDTCLKNILPMILVLGKKNTTHCFIFIDLSISFLMNCFVYKL